MKFKSHLAGRKRKLIFSYLYHSMNITFRPCKLSSLFLLNQNIEIKIVPHIMFFVTVIFKIYTLVVKNRSVQTYKKNR